MRYKKQYNDSSQVLVSCETGNSIERGNLFATYLSSSYSWNYKQFKIFSALKKEENNTRDDSLKIDST